MCLYLLSKLKIYTDISMKDGKANKKIQIKADYFTLICKSFMMECVWGCSYRHHICLVNKLTRCRDTVQLIRIRRWVKLSNSARWENKAQSWDQISSNEQSFRLVSSPIATTSATKLREVLCCQTPSPTAHSLRKEDEEARAGTSLKAHH